jgi:hypothetical protein
MERRKQMAPEREETLAVMDLSFDNGKVQSQIEFWKAPSGKRLWVNWPSQSQPKGYAPIHGGVAYYFVGEDEAPTFIEPHPYPLDCLDDSRFVWKEGGFVEGKASMMMILILPKDYTLTDPQPTPIGAKTFDGRLALYWIPIANSKGRADVEWTLKPFNGDLLSEVQRINKNHANVPTSSPVGMPRKLPSWFPIAGAVFGGITLLFLMLLIVFSLFSKEIPTTSRFILVALIALGIGLSSTFLGGDAAARGALSLPFFKESPMSFAVTGGIAAFIIVLVLGYALYVR